MKQKSITFRCSATQSARFTHALEQGNQNRTDFLTAALESFLSYAEQAHIQKLNLFELVQDVDAQGEGERFEQQA